MAFDASPAEPLICYRYLLATSDRAPTKRLARAGVAAAGGGFGLGRTGGAAALRGSKRFMTKH